MVSAYESRRREPSVETLRRIVESAGFDLSRALSPARSTPLHTRIREHRNDLVRSLRAEGARSVSVFRSVARGNDGVDSDVDLLVDIDDSVGLFALGRMRSKAEEILSSPVNIVPVNSLKPDLRSHVLAEAVRL
ncbi:hypothetical protein B7R22_10150 [Subtercola boreus]|uniref:Polymerase nucleotidyl transferase domain-containing protein n=1 Tax=Subtercola boreus TaxID=120213 RepID=A0A3E0VWT1_9MICO|nr:hypothetical protein B7R22_10150 [Subtercola boreus]